MSTQQRIGVLIRHNSCNDGDADDESGSYSNQRIGHESGPPLPESQAKSHDPDPGSLTAVSQTVETAPDSGALGGRPVDPDLRRWIPQHWPDTLL